ALLGPPLDNSGAAIAALKHEVGRAQVKIALPGRPPMTAQATSFKNRENIFLKLGRFGGSVLCSLGLRLAHKSQHEGEGSTTEQRVPEVVRRGHCRVQWGRTLLLPLHSRDKFIGMTGAAVPAWSRRRPASPFRERFLE